MKLSKDGQENKTQELFEYERDGDAKILKHTTYITCKAHIGYGTEDKQEYNKMQAEGQYKHVIFTNEDNVPDMKPLTRTMNFAQINGQTDTIIQGTFTVTSSNLPCGCSPYFQDINSVANLCV